mmetsp:Transcript_15006/g.44812  ORF Transcript_15006/g.44812 Transcript_15006/m.44812 type:complete len:219 (+) Transcript_15006:241-897(+)
MLRRLRRLRFRNLLRVPHLAPSRRRPDQGLLVGPPPDDPLRHERRRRLLRLREMSRIVPLLRRSRDDEWRDVARRPVRRRRDARSGLRLGRGRQRHALLLRHGDHHVFGPAVPPERQDDERCVRRRLRRRLSHQPTERGARERGPRRVHRAGAAGGVFLGSLHDDLPRAGHRDLRKRRHERPARRGIPLRRPAGDEEHRGPHARTHADDVQLPRPHSR